MLLGILLGTAVITVALWLVRTLQAGAPPTIAPDPLGPTGLLLLAGTLTGVLTGGIAAWTLMAPISSIYRRGGLSVVAGFATLLVSILDMPLDHYFGRGALLAFFVFCLASSVLLARRRQRNSQASP
jgi:hypothetical protein